MREKISSLKKFDAVFLNGDSNNLDKIENQIKNINSNIPIFRTLYKISNIKNYDLKSKYLMFSGIGNPSDFKNILLENKFDIVTELIFPDHYKYNLNDFEKIKDKARNQNLKIITTEKDYMKVPDEFKNEFDFFAIDLVIENEDKLRMLLNN